MNKVIDINNNLDTPLYRSSLLENLQPKHQYFELPDFDSIITRQKQQDILQTIFSVQLLPKSYTNDDTIP